MPANGILTPAQKRNIAAWAQSMVELAPKVKMFKALGGEDEELEARIKQLYETCIAANEVDEAFIRGELE